MTNEVQEPKLIGRECKFAVYCPPPKDSGMKDDFHLVKERQFFSDGTSKPATFLYRNFVQDFYVTKKGHRNHEQKKEWTDINTLDRFESTRSNLTRAIAKALGMPGFSGDQRMLSRSPFLYGTDILSTSLIKNKYAQKWPDAKSPFSVAVMDTESDVVNGTERVIMTTISMKDRVYTSVTKAYADGIANFQDRCHAALLKYLGPHVEKRGIKWEVEVVDDSFKSVERAIMKAHEWKPDFVTFWNMDHDIPLIIEECRLAGVDPKDVFSDPSVPYPYRHFRYKQGRKSQETASNVFKPIKPADQWHTVYTPASFYIIDSMCVYRKLRSQKGEEPKYSLDYILGKILGERKLKFEEAEGMEKIDWHIFMQKNYKIEYIIYNVFDCVSVELLDEKTKDLQFAMPLACGMSDFEMFKSQPRRTADKLHYFCLEKGRVIGSTSDEMANDPLNKYVLSASGWITTLPAHTVTEGGLCCIEEAPDTPTNVYTQVAD